MSATVSERDLAAIEEVLGMHDGYVLDFSNRTFSYFFAEHDVEIYSALFATEGNSKACRLRAFLRTAPAYMAATVLEELLERRGERDGDVTSKNLAQYRRLIARLRGAPMVALPTVSADVLSLSYVAELDKKTEQRLAAEDLEGAITTARTMLEAVLEEIERQLTTTPCDHKGDLPKLFKSVSKQLRIDEERADLDDNFKQVVRGLVQIVNGLAPLRNKMSDGHARKRKPAPHHARIVMNAARTVATFLIESFVAQREKGLLPERDAG